MGVGRAQRRSEISTATDPAAKPVASSTATHEALLTVGTTAATVARAFADTLRAAVRLRPQDIPERRRDDLSAYGAALLAAWPAVRAKLLADPAELHRRLARRSGSDGGNRVVQAEACQ